MKKPIISIIIPIYNSKKYIMDCLKSVYNQDINENLYEVVCVNDGSTDESIEIIEKYKKNNNINNLRIINQENMGFAGACNTGSDNATGEYVWFLGSDDFIDKNCLKKIAKIIDDEKVDFLTVGMKYFADSDSYEDQLQYMDKDVSRLKNKTSSKIGCIGPRIIKKSIIDENNISFKSGITSEDFLYLFYVSLHCENPKYCKDINYFCRENPTSLSRTKSEKRMEISYNSAKVLIEAYNNELLVTKSEKKKRKIEASLRNAIESLLLKAAISQDKDRIEDALKYLKENGFYPYKHNYPHLLFVSCLANTFVNYVCFLFPNEKYYRFCCKHLTALWNKLR